MPRGHYERKPRTESNAVAGSGPSVTADAMASMNRQMVRTELVRVLHVHGRSAADIIAKARELEAYILGDL